MRVFFALIIATIVALAGCSGSGKTDSKEEIRRAIESYLAERPNLTMANMDLEVGEVKFEGDSAAAEVKFRSKQSADLAVTVHYQLKRAGGQWKVESTAPASGPGGSPHGQIAPASPHGATPLESSH